MLAAGGLFVLLSTAMPACGSTPAPPAVDELDSQQQLARHDSGLATAAAVTAPPTLTAALTEVAAERAEHARALAAEIARVAGQPQPTSTEASAENTGTSATGLTAPPPTVSDVVNALRTAADNARKLATESSGYQAGLLASIAAACTAAYTVALVAP